MITMAKHIYFSTVYGQVIELVQSHMEDDACLHSIIHTFDASKRTFSTSVANSVQLSLDAEAVINWPVRVKNSPHISEHVVFRSNDIHHVDIVTIGESGSIEIADSAQVPESLIGGNVMLCDGPTLIILQSSKMFIASCLGNTIETHTVSTHTEDAYSCSEIIWCQTYEPYLVAVLQVTNPANNRFKLITLCINILEKPFNCVQLKNSFMPDVYAGVIKCVCTLTLSIHPNNSPLSDDYQFIFKSDVLICTSMGQLCELHDDGLVQCVDLPFNDPQSVKIFEAFGGDTYVVVGSASQSICIVLLNTFVIVKQWDKIDQFFISDFVSCGTEQLLVVTSGQVGDEDVQFILTDFTAHHFNCTASRNNTQDNCKSLVAEKQLCAIDALQTRLQQGLSNVAVKEMELSEKTNLIDQTRAALYEMQLGGSKQAPHEPYLFNLLETHTEEPKTIDPGRTCPVATGAIWQKVVDQHWVIGVNIEHIKRQTDKLSLLLLPQAPYNKAYESNSTVLYSNIPTDTVPSKRQRLSDCKEPKDIIKFLKIYQGNSNDENTTRQPVCIVARTSLPEFGGSTNVGLTLLIQWREERSLPYQIPLVDVTLSVCDVLDGKYGISDINYDDKEESRQALATLQCLQIVQELELRSVHSDMPKMFPTLLNNVGFVWIESWNCYYCNIEPLKWIRIFLALSSRHSLALRIFSRSDSHVLLLVHKLYSELPDDVIILPSKQDASSSARNTIHHMNREISVIKKHLMENIKKSEASNDGFVNEKDDIETIRQRFSLKRKQFAESDNLPVDSSNTEEIDKLRKSTDTAVISMLNNK